MLKKKFIYWIQLATNKKAHLSRIIITIAVVSLLVLILDALLPTTKQEVNVHTVDNPPDMIRYIIPLSGGGVGYCSATPQTLDILKQFDPIVIHVSALFNRCSAVLPSWPVDTDFFFKKAIRFSYGNEYSTLEELQQDYPDYTPKLRLYGIDHWFMPSSFRRYSVQMPKELVIFNTDGDVLVARKCGTAGGYCTPVEPVTPSFTQGG